VIRFLGPFRSGCCLAARRERSLESANVGCRFPMLTVKKPHGRYGKNDTLESKAKGVRNINLKVYSESDLSYS
jgi:hypothetical protein